MSLQVQLLFSFPQGRVTVISVFLLLFGCCSIGVSVLGFTYNIWGSYVASGAWGGGVAAFAGFCGIIAAYKRGVCNVISYMSIAYFSCLASVGQLILSVGGLEYKSNFYLNVANYEHSNKGTTKLLHGLLVGFAVFQIVLSAISAGISTRQICIGKKKLSKTRNTNIYFQRGTVRESTSSQAPLVASSRNRSGRHKKRKSKNKQPEAKIIDDSVQTDQSNKYNGDNSSRIRGRRFGNMPTVGSNIVEYTNTLERNRNRNVVTCAEVFNSRHENDLSASSSRRRGSTGNYSRRPNLSSENTRGRSHSQERVPHIVRRHEHQDNDDLQNRTNRKLALEQGSGYTQNSGKDDTRASFTQANIQNIRNDNLSDNRFHSVPGGSNSERTSNFIPMERSFETPLSIDDDEELPPYVEVVPRAEAEEDESLLPVSQFGTSRNSVDDFSLSSHESDSRMMRQDSYTQPHFGTNTFAKQNNQRDLPAHHVADKVTSRNSRPASFYNEVKSNSVRERSRTMENVPHHGLTGKLPSPERERFIRNYFFLDQDPQGISYYGVLRDGDQIYDQEKAKRTKSFQHNRERALAKEGATKSQSHEYHKNNDNQVVKENIDDTVSCHSQPNVQYDTKQVVRRLSKASTMSLPASMAPPKPPRIFTIELGENNRLHHKENSSPNIHRMKDVNKSGNEGSLKENKFTADKHVAPPGISNTTHDHQLGSEKRQTDFNHVKHEIPVARDNKNSLPIGVIKKDDIDSKSKKAWEPLSIETNSTKPAHVDTIGSGTGILQIADRPFAHSSPKLKNFNEMSVHQEPPSLSPIITQKENSEIKKWPGTGSEIGSNYSKGNEKNKTPIINDRQEDGTKTIVYNPDNITCTSQSSKRMETSHPLSLQPYLQKSKANTIDSHFTSGRKVDTKPNGSASNRAEVKPLNQTPKSLSLNKDSSDSKSVPVLSSTTTHRLKLPASFHPSAKNQNLSVFNDQTHNSLLEGNVSYSGLQHKEPTEISNVRNSIQPVETCYSSQTRNISNDPGYHSNTLSQMSVSDQGQDTVTESLHVDPQQQPAGPENQQPQGPREQQHEAELHKPMYSILL